MTKHRILIEFESDTIPADFTDQIAGRVYSMNGVTKGDVTAQIVGRNMFWNRDDPERSHDSIDEFLNEEICNGMGVEVGAKFTMLQAVSLPKVHIRVTSINEEECEAEYEFIDAAKDTQ